MTVGLPNVGDADQKIAPSSLPPHRSNGMTWTNRNSVFNQDLNITGQMLEVGPSFTLHNNAPVRTGPTEIDFFEITVRKTQRPLDATWNPGNANASGN